MIHISTGRRLHFGLFAPAAVPELDLAYGGLGIMADAPGIIIEASPADQWTIEGEHADRVEGMLSSLRTSEPALRPLAIRLNYVAPAHQGWGTGTQLALALARACYAASELPWSASQAALCLGRGKRSGIGIVGFEQGGLLFDKGKTISPTKDEDSAPAVVSQPFPRDWTWVLVEPGQEQGLFSEEERQAFTRLPAIDREVVRQLRGLASGLVTAAQQVEFKLFAEQLTEYNRLAGSFYRTVQHGDYSSTVNEQRLAIMADHGAIGRGQSSWGPGLYAVFPDRRTAEAFRQRCQLPGCTLRLSNVMVGALS